MAYDEFRAAAKEAIAFVHEHDPKEIVLLHHNDADGLTSATILLKAFERQHVPVRRYCLENVYPEVLERLLGGADLGDDVLVVFADFASGNLPEIARFNNGRRGVLVLDHHGIVETEDPKIFLLNCRKYGINGSTDCSASTVCFEFARALSEDNLDLAYIAALGAFGDRHVDEDGDLTGINREAFLLVGSENKQASDQQLINALNVLGSVGYLSGGPDIAVKGLSESVDEGFYSYVEKYAGQYWSALEELISSNPLVADREVNWFSLGAAFEKMGVKTVGLICDAMIDRKTCPSDRYLVGFQKIPEAIPGLGIFNFGKIKVSLRTPPLLRKKVDAGEAVPLTELVPKAAKAVGGEPAACHTHAAAANIPVGKEKDFVAAVNKWSG